MKKYTKTPATLGLLVLICSAALPRAASAGAADAVGSSKASATERLGSVSFPVSCSPAVQGSFNRGVALLHDFWYEEAKPQFEKIGSVPTASTDCSMPARPPKLRAIPSRPAVTTSRS
jgi:hypothetical protein